MTSFFEQHRLRNGDIISFGGWCGSCKPSEEILRKLAEEKKKELIQKGHTCCFTNDNGTLLWWCNCFDKCNPLNYNERKLCAKLDKNKVIGIETEGISEKEIKDDVYYLAKQLVKSGHKCLVFHDDLHYTWCGLNNCESLQQYDEEGSEDDGLRW